MTARPQIGVVLPRDLPSSLVLPYAREAERLGFDELWVVEDLGFRGGLVQAAAVLGATERLRVGIGILPAAVRNPAFAAMEIATLEQLHPGRTDVGIGHGMPGWMRQAGCWPDRPLAFLSEYVTTLRALLGGTEVAGLRLDPSAVPDVVPPLLLGVRGPRSLAASGQVADGTVLAEPVTPEYATAARGAIAPRGEHRLVAYNIGAVDDDGHAALRTARPGLAWVGEPDWAPHVTPLDFADEFTALRERCGSREEFTERMPDDWVGRLALAGTPAEVRAKIDELGRAGVTSSVFIPAGPDPLAALAALARVL
ncbi:LLM class flavin-dependent oxidoreductase [Myceligenerans xiligouense]|uniref:Alkanesulfonate monooxygenase SsuD/methylene tetrahydromethanopterin reductase-like flavin-dependent oxidoreductase (Luciferase family) n=1 Tax=Myceligenerans xiligouense TaxID=253184 RepID=A0A3N4YQU9_9MICO|nr:LLM class flavin-dependent oxidoreductase [Myceligenerans xiligouense]RPF21886.1 alkanesulfonate monooxygenase SsuD/methylene tetrahydromethanopterin reductase-like flavin-dependent oxidoreductase (luciferase family) [Myceligenerans xiligouense]